MLCDLYYAIRSLRSEFSRERSWLMFFSVIISFLAAHEMRGVTSMCRYWLSDSRGYERLRHFFSCAVLLH